ncbi:hypothetical protein B0T16DRAFT_411882 [Cercophora newfieldiana]|uniref:Uncharacterized protein n=1 Tax=Cercophora newfieldiana TaxID=92897 RepID=A0AA40CNT3_9PEZI|nr:hypothetical protein B0T16DRAFT_411882 [Cercophora newfieldiana]
MSGKDLWQLLTITPPLAVQVGLVEDRRQQTRQEQNTSFFWPHFLELSIFHYPNRSEMCVPLYCLGFVFFFLPVQLSPLASSSAGFTLRVVGTGTQGAMDTSLLLFWLFLFLLRFFLPSRSSEHGNNKLQPRLETRGRDDTNGKETHTQTNHSSL